MNKTSTTVRIRFDDKAKLDELCRTTKRGISHMLSLLIEREHNRTIRIRKAS